MVDLQLTAGSVRAKSVKSVCLKNIMDAAFGGCAYYLLGWGFAYGDHQTCDDAGVCTDVNNAFIGSNNFAMSLTPDTNFATFYFQYVVSLQCLIGRSTPFQQCDDQPKRCSSPSPHVSTKAPTSQVGSSALL